MDIQLETKFVKSRSRRAFRTVKTWKGRRFVYFINWKLEHTAPHISYMHPDLVKTWSDILTNDLNSYSKSYSRWEAVRIGIKVLQSTYGLDDPLRHALQEQTIRQVQEKLENPPERESGDRVRRLSLDEINNYDKPWYKGPVTRSLEEDGLIHHGDPSW